MSNNVFETPDAELIKEENGNEPTFYVVSPLKFTVMYLGTFSFFSLWWFYANWRNYSRRQNIPMWPIARAIFAIFFTHSLFGQIDDELEKKKIDYTWASSMFATIYVVVLIFGALVDAIFGDPNTITATYFVYPLMLPISAFVLFRAQLAINQSQDDVGGTSNNNFTVYNFLWLALGLVYWALMLITALWFFGLI